VFESQGVEGIPEVRKLSIELGNEVVLLRDPLIFLGDLRS
jgi:SpoU rRNA methylase family enzyme